MIRPFGFVVCGLTGLALSFGLADPGGGRAEAALSAQTSIQGVLTDNAGNLVPDGTYALTFRLYAAASGGAALWSESHGAVPVAKGGFSVLLGSVATLGALPFDNDYWLGVSVAGGAELVPRVKLASSPYAFHSRRAVELVLPYNTTVSLSSPPLTVTNNGTAPAVLAQTNSSAANAFGLRGFVGAATPSPTSAGVKGENISATANGSGVWGSHNGSGRGVYGYAPGGTGVFGETVNGFGLQGLSLNGTGILGQTNSAAAGAYAIRGVLGAAVPGNGAAAVRGEGSAGNPNTVGVWGFHPGAGTGVFGHSTSGIGVSGFTGGSGAAGVYGTSTSTGSPGVKASNANAGGTALEIQQGALRVAGAGFGTATTAFVHQATAANTSVIAGVPVSRIDNPICNGRQDALLFLTPSRRQGAFAVPYVNYISGFWYIGLVDDSSPTGLIFNVLIVRSS